MTTNMAAKPSIQRPIETPLAPRPSISVIYAKPLPLNTYPLPPLIPHNPISILHIAFTYIYQILAPPSSHPNVPYKAYWSPETRSVHVTDEIAIRALWENGFFGKGSLSRSEPTWLDREKRKRGLLVNETSEEVTKQRREERKRFKKERARKEREAIEEKLEEEKRSKENGGTATPTARAKYEGVNGSPVQSLTESIEALVVQEPEDPPTPAPILMQTDGLSPKQTINGHTKSTLTNTDSTIPSIQNQEHLQLTPSEAFFLTYALGVLSIYPSALPDSSAPLSTSRLLHLFRYTSYQPPTTSSLRPDDPFLLSYVTYHHFRSLGWVVRPGLKFGVDWLLYLRGPVFSHAEFAVIVLPAYTDSYWRETEEVRKETERREKRSWWWVHCVNRVQSQVRKTLVLTWVEVPGVEEVEKVSKGRNKEESMEGEVVDIGRLLGLYKVREMTLKRWIPNRERD